MPTIKTSRKDDKQMQFSVLDQAPVPQGMTQVEAVRATVRLAQKAEEWGYERYWIAEHHGMRGLSCSAPEILMAHVAAHTKHIRVGSGGILLPHYSPYKVAELIRMLEALHPGRIDLGIGRAPGGGPLNTRALQQGHSTPVDEFPQKLIQLMEYLQNSWVTEERGHHQVITTPMGTTLPHIWLLGSSFFSAECAAENGLAFSFAHFINADDAFEAIKLYRQQFRPSLFLKEPRVSLALFAICADNEETANRLALSRALWKLQRSDNLAIPSVDEALHYQQSGADMGMLSRLSQDMVIGNQEQVKEQLNSLCNQYDTDDLTILTVTHDLQARLRSYELIAST